jgi:hypothetical protein
MGWLKKVFGKQQEAPAPTASPEHAVIVTFPYGSGDLQRLFDLEDDLIVAIEAAGVGKFDGNEVAVDGSEASLYMYGPDADRLWEAVEPALRGCEWLKTATAQVRYGPPGAEKRLVEVGTF